MNSSRPTWKVSEVGLESCLSNSKAHVLFTQVVGGAESKLKLYLKTVIS